MGYLSKYYLGEECKLICVYKHVYIYIYMEK